ncbi:hypothetical protein [Streptomyces sp. NPDC059564]|uniref:hypothetical protein n=1 Tax=Streptomyces sp. NPDC059564 TaxID=3346865 RepID=UPI0036A455C6
MADRAHFPYTGPRDLLVLVQNSKKGRLITSSANLTPEDAEEPHTFIIDTDGRMRISPRRSEHVVCAGGEPVLSAGEVTFTQDLHGWTVDEVSNQSTGYCPDISSWVAVSHALDLAGIGHPGQFTQAIVFRFCPECNHLNIVREQWFVCVFCDGILEKG